VPKAGENLLPYTWNYSNFSTLTAQQYASVVLAVIVCLSDAGIVSKRLNAESYKQHHMMAQGV